MDQSGDRCRRDSACAGGSHCNERIRPGTGGPPSSCHLAVSWPGEAPHKDAPGADGQVSPRTPDYVTTMTAVGNAAGERYRPGGRIRRARGSRQYRVVASSVEQQHRDRRSASRVLRSAVWLRCGGLPSRPQLEVVPDPARLERAATLTNCGLGAPLPGKCALGGFTFQATRRPRRRHEDSRIIVRSTTRADRSGPPLDAGAWGQGVVRSSARRRSGSAGQARTCCLASSRRTISTSSDWPSCSGLSGDRHATSTKAGNGHPMSRKAPKVRLLMTIPLIRSPTDRASTRLSHSSVRMITSVPLDAAMGPIAEAMALHGSRPWHRVPMRWNVIDGAAVVASAFAKDPVTASRSTGSFIPRLIASVCTAAPFGKRVRSWSPGRIVPTRACFSQSSYIAGNAILKRWSMAQYRPPTST